MNKSLLDTDILSEIIKARDAAVTAKANAYLPALVSAALAGPHRGNSA
jgi:hypothetical protein